MLAIEILSHVLTDKPQSIKAICADLSQYAQWQRRQSRTGKWAKGDPLPQKNIEQDVLRILQYDSKTFVKTAEGLWRLRNKYACSFCLREDGLRARGDQHGVYICLECAELAVDTLREKKAEADRLVQHETAIMNNEEILGA